MSLEKSRRAASDEFHGAFRDAINARGLTLARLHEMLRARGNGVSMTTLSYWRSGRRRPEGVQSLTALADIEILLDLRAGALTGLLGSTNRTGPVGPNLFPIDEQGLELAVIDAFDAMGAEYPDTSRELTTHSITDVDEHGNVSHCTTRSIIQSTVGTVRSIPFLELTPGESTPAPIIEAISGGRISARYSHPSGEVHGVLFELDVPLAAPDTAIVEWSVDFPPGYPAQRDSGHAVAMKARELLVWTRFHPDALPDRIEERVDTPDGVITTALDLGGRHSVHQVRRAFGPGALGISWSYDDGR
ncbi:helix-turn-helix domain-containing protein [Microbacterium maritypicum]|jgi:transcriptional regulator with XRE-family HTH domain